MNYYIDPPDQSHLLNKLIFLKLRWFEVGKGEVNKQETMNGDDSDEQQNSKPLNNLRHDKVTVPKNLWHVRKCTAMSF